MAAQTAAHLVDCVIPRVPVRQLGLSFPIPLRMLFAAHPDLLSPLLQIMHRVIAAFLLKQVGLKRTQAHTGAVTLIQRFGSAANLNIHLQWQVADGVYSTEGMPVFHEVRAPGIDELQEQLGRIINRIMKRTNKTTLHALATGCETSARWSAWRRGSVARGRAAGRKEQS